MNNALPEFFEPTLAREGLNGVGAHHFWGRLGSPDESVLYDTTFAPIWAETRSNVQFNYDMNKVGVLKRQY